jgi:hypothetical protein
MALSFGALILVMLLLSPVCHLHYFCLSVPLIMAWMAAHWEEVPPMQVGWAVLTLLGFNVIANTLPNLPRMEWSRDGGLATLAALVLWTVANSVVWKRSRHRPGRSVQSRMEGAAA